MSVPDFAAPGALLDEGLCAFVAGGVSIGIGTRDADLRPHTVRAVGGRHDAGRIVLFVPCGPGAPVLRDIEANGRIAVVFSSPSSHRTVQLKGRDAHVVPLEPDDRAIAFAYREALGRDLMSIGYPPGLVEPLLAGIEGPLAGVAFTPDEGFDATPGPRAGAPLRGGA